MTKAIINVYMRACVRACVRVLWAFRLSLKFVSCTTFWAYLRNILPAL